MPISSLPKKLHFIGVGGVSMSALAKLAVLKGHAVTGSDLYFGDWYPELTEAGADVYVGSNKIYAQNADLVIYNSAIKDDDQELFAARAQGVPAVQRSLFLSAVASDYKKVIAVSGTHGKTTVSAMLAHVFSRAEKKMTAHVGGIPNGGSNLTALGDEFFITEACEYKRNFLSLSPDIGVILNVESDHPDCYSSLSELYSAFELFTARSKTAVVSGDCEYYRMRACAYGHTVTFSDGNTADYVAENVLEYLPQRFAFDVVARGVKLGRISLAVYGRHNVSNALAAVAVAEACEIPFDVTVAALGCFSGIKRRFEMAGECMGARIIVDYAHHPSEIRAVIKTARGLNPKRLKVVFQPHTFSRTAALFDEFAHAFTDADELYVLKCFSARETPADGKTALELATRIKSDVMYCAYYEDTLSASAAIMKNAARGDVVLILGAGDVAGLADLLNTIR